MKLFIILIIAAAAVYFGITGFSNIIHPQDKKKPAAAHAETVTPPLPVLSPPTGPAPGVPLAESGNTPPPPVAVVNLVAVYQFKNRPVPQPPFGRNQSQVGSGPDASGLELSLDQGANSWIMRGPPNEVEQMQRIAGFVDVQQSELDLDFLLVSVSEDWLRSYGLGASYETGASWLNRFSISGDNSSLRLESNGFAVDLSFGQSDGAAQFVSAPVVRCVTGEEWEFSADQQVPIQSAQISQGVVATAYEYKNVGLGFSGLLQKGGPRSAYRLTLMQRNGTVDPQDASVTRPPVLRSQMLKSSLVVEVGRWSCVGGVGSWRISRKKKLFGSTETESQDLLLVFVRPRDALSVAPRAIAIGDGPERLSDSGVGDWDIPPDGSLLLPLKGWQRGAKDLFRLSK